MGQLEIQVAVAKVHRYASSESGDTLEMIERPHGGLSFVLADGQGHGRPAKAISNLVAKKAVGLLADGVRDGAAARGTHDFLYAYRQGKVSATLNIVSVDLASRSIVLSRNSHCPVIVSSTVGLRCLDEESQPIGIFPGTKPVITEVPMAPDTHVIVFTDGILEAGARFGLRFDVVNLVTSLLANSQLDVQALAEAILAAAIARDQGRPNDDMSVLVLRMASTEEKGEVRRLLVSFPLGETIDKR
ncbi:MAG: PP2C family protein-serine/threonine phosphatase [Chloroflexota bacterium]